MGDEGDIQHSDKDKPKHTMEGLAASCDAGETVRKRAMTAWKVGYLKWIADTGCGINLIVRRMLARFGLTQHTRKLRTPYPLDTAGGLTQCDGAERPLFEFESLGGPTLKQMISRLTMNRSTNTKIESVSDINLDRDGQTVTDKALRVWSKFLNGPTYIVAIVTYVGELPRPKSEEPIPLPPPPIAVPEADADQPERKDQPRRSRKRDDLRREARSLIHSYYILLNTTIVSYASKPRCKGPVPAEKLSVAQIIWKKNSRRNFVTSAQPIIL